MYDLRSDQEVIGYQDSSLNAGVTSVALSNSGRLIFAGYDDFNCHIWDTLKGEKVGEWRIVYSAVQSDVKVSEGRLILRKRHGGDKGDVIR